MGGAYIGKVNTISSNQVSLTEDDRHQNDNQLLKFKRLIDT